MKHIKKYTEYINETYENPKGEVVEFNENEVKYLESKFLSVKFEFGEKDKKYLKINDAYITYKIDGFYTFKNYDISCSTIQSLVKIIQKMIIYSEKYTPIILDEILSISPVKDFDDDKLHFNIEKSMNMLTIDNARKEVVITIPIATACYTNSAKIIKYIEPVLKKEYNLFGYKYLFSHTNANSTKEILNYFSNKYPLNLD